MAFHRGLHWLCPLNIVINDLDENREGVLDAVENTKLRVENASGHRIRFQEDLDIWKTRMKIKLTGIHISSTLS